jgi:hypothetical protein
MENRGKVSKTLQIKMHLTKKDDVSADVAIGSKACFILFIIFDFMAGLRAASPLATSPFLEGLRFGLCFTAGGNLELFVGFIYDEIDLFINCEWLRNNFLHSI